jgi:sulfatase maturation enzyme AslB (radical SAM superfamily)
VAALPQLGRFCLPIGPDLYLDTINHSPCSAADLEQRCLLAGQERAAITNRILRVHQAQVVVIPSLECNLRCPHCYVGHLLQRPTGSDYGTTDPAVLCSFIDSIVNYPGWGLTWLSLVGGEPFLHPQLIRLLLERYDTNFDITTNGIWDFDSVVDILGNQRLKSITFSVDGLPEHHNRVRRALDHEPDTFAITYRNLARTAKLSAGTGRKIIAQGSIVHGSINDDDVRRYRALMAIAGVDPRYTYLAYAAPSRIRPQSPDYYMRRIERARRPTPCCDYRLGFMIVVAGGLVYGSYYNMLIREPLGSVADTPAAILERHKQQILKYMPLLADDTCMDDCCAVGVCWGLCSNTDVARSDAKPSELCDRRYKLDVLHTQIREKYGNVI